MKECDLFVRPLNSMSSSIEQLGPAAQGDYLPVNLHAGLRKVT